MIKSIILLVFILSIQNSFCQVTFIVENLPKNTSKNAEIFISGDFENWTGGQEKYKLKNIDNKYFTTIPKTTKPIYFKFTQGDWKNVETDKNGHDLENRTYTFHKENDTVKIDIQAWSNKVNKK